MAISIRDIPFGSTVESLEGLTSFLDSQREGELQSFESHRVLDAYYDRGVFNAHEGWYTVCLENSDGERFWVQAPEQQVTTWGNVSRDLGIGTLPPVPEAIRVFGNEVELEDRIEHDGIEGTVVSLDYHLDENGVPDGRILSVRTADGTESAFALSADERLGYEDRGLYATKRVHSLRQVPEGTTVGLQLAYEPVRGGDFPAPRHMLQGTIRELKPADPAYGNMLVYMVNADGEGWLKVPTSQGIRVVKAAPGSVPPAPWDASDLALAASPSMGEITREAYIADMQDEIDAAVAEGLLEVSLAAGPENATLAETVPGAVVSGLTVYPLDAVTGLTEERARVLDNTLIQDINPLGVDVDGKAMMLLAIHDQNQESVVIAQQDSTLTRDFDVPDRAKPSPVRLAPMSEWSQFTAHHTPVLAQGTNMQGRPASFYGTLSGIRPVDDGWIASIAEGNAVGFVSELHLPQDGISRFEGQSGGEVLPVLPAAYLKPGQTIVNDDGARALVIANQAGRSDVRTIVVQLDGVGVNGGIEVPSEKLFAVENSLAPLTPDEIEDEMSVAQDIHQMPEDWEEAFAKVVGVEDHNGPGLG